MRQRIYPFLVLFTLFVGLRGFAVWAETLSGPAESVVRHDTFSRLYENSLQSVVFIVVADNQGSGSGITWTREGYIFTNAHVVGVEKEVIVYVDEHNYHKARVVGTDGEFDIALLKIDDPVDLTPANFGNSKKIRPGELIYTIGTPLNSNFRNSITVGIVSGVERYVTDGVQEVMQVDAALNPGNSGGPVYNLRGEVIGMVVSILPDANNISFVIPSNDVLLVAGEILKNGKMTYARLGITMIDLSRVVSEKVARQNNLSWPLVQKAGILVSKITENSPAEVAGVELGDIVLSFNGDDVTSLNRFRRRIALSPVGIPIFMTVQRGGKKIDLWITPVERLPYDKSDKALEKREENKSEENPFLTGVKNNPF